MQANSWYWDNNYDGDDEDLYEYDKSKKNFKRVVFIYRSWFSGMGKINVTVTYKDEPEIRKFIFSAQSNQKVFI